MTDNASTNLDTALADLIGKALEGADAASAFLVEQTPEVVQQVLLWYGVYNFILFLLGVAILSVSTYVVFKYTGKGEKIDGSTKYRQTLSHDQFGGVDGDRILGTGLVYLFVVILTPILTINLQWLKIWIAPKLWLIEYAAQLVK